jgi:hypothetical protein
MESSVDRRARYEGLARARTCYGHLAGRLAVAFWARARDARWVRWSDVAVRLLPRGREALTACGLFDGASPTHMRMELGRPCLDWSERVPHVAGPLGVTLCDALLTRRWVVRVKDGRTLRITPRGGEALRALGVTGLE